MSLRGAPPQRDDDAMPGSDALAAGRHAVEESARVSVDRTLHRDAEESVRNQWWIEDPRSRAIMARGLSCIKWKL